LAKSSAQTPLPSDNSLLLKKFQNGVFTDGGGKTLEKNLKY
jgi:hypothetical protein